MAFQNILLMEEPYPPTKVSLRYDESRWEEMIARPVKTLQVFITNRCNARCKACFYAKGLNDDEMSFEDYTRIVSEYAGIVEKVILLGGEPTLHSRLGDMIGFNRNNGLKTTVYSNGYNLKPLEKYDLSGTSIRIGVLGLRSGEKQLAGIKTKLPVTVVYMLRKSNISELMETAMYAESNFDCKGFYISSIRDIAATNNYWAYTEDIIPLLEYSQIAQGFIDKYRGNLKTLHIAKRGILTTPKQDECQKITKCRFLNALPDKKRIICPFDISRGITAKGHSQDGIIGKDYKIKIGARSCNKNDECLLQKIVLKSK